MKRLLAGILLICLLFTTAAFGEDLGLENEKKNILIIHSYHQDFLWTRSLHDAIVEESVLEGWNVFTEHLDAYRLSPEEIQAKKDRILNDYKGKPIDAIIVSDNAAFSFIQDIHDDYFAEVPVFFVGVNNVDVSDLDGSLYTGLMQNTDLVAFYDSLDKILPNLETLYVVGSDSGTANKIYQELDETNEASGGPITIQPILSDNLDNQLTQISRINKETGAIYVAGSFDVMNHNEYASLIESQAKVPTFVGVSVAIDGNVLGGYVVDPRAHGSYITSTIKAVLLGESISDFEIREVPLEKIVYNYRGLIKYKIDETLLPKDAVIINQPANDITISRNALLTILITLIMTMILLLLLLYILRSREKYTKALLKAKMELQETHMELEAHAEELMASQETLEYQYEELEQNRDQIQQLITFDSNTGFYNPKSFLDSIRDLKNLEEHSDFHVIHVFITNIDNVIQYMDGGLIDPLIKTIAYRIQSIFQANAYSYCVDRSGHFFILSHATTKAIERDLDTLTELFSTAFKTEFYTVYLNLKIGVSSYPSNAESGDELMKYARIAALSILDEQNKKMEYFRQDMLEKEHNRQRKIAAIDQAIENGEFDIFLQPKYDTSILKIVGFEALIRWIKPDGTMIYPDQFISLSEKTGQIDEITFLVIEKAARLIQEYKLDQAGLHIAVNLSSVNFKRMDLVDQINEIVDRYGLSHTAFEFELTETGLLEDFDMTSKILHQLQSDGYTIALDDFGTGYSSLSYISKLPVDKIKLDRSFVMNLSDRKQMKIVIAMIQLAHQMNFGVVVEGVEEKNQVAILSPFRPEEYQGYYFSKPLPAKDAIELYFS